MSLARRLGDATARYALQRTRTRLSAALSSDAPRAPLPPPRGDHLSIAVEGNACTSLLSACVAAAFKKSLALETRLPAEIFALGGAGGRRHRAVLNALVGSVPHARYLEAGNDGPGAACAAMYNNVAHVTCIVQGRRDHESALLATSTPYRSDLIQFSVVDCDLKTAGRHAIGRSNILFWTSSASEAFDLVPDILDDEFILIADRWNSAAVREHVAAAIAQASFTPVYDVTVRTTQDDSLAKSNGPESDWDQGCRIVVLRRTQCRRTDA